MKIKFVFLILPFILFACEGQVFTPKPKAYPKVEYPEKTYLHFDKNYCNFTFEYPAYASIQQDSKYFDEVPVNPCWFDIYIPAFDSRIHCSYYPINAENSFEKLKTDAFQLANKHTLKATYIEEIPIQNAQGINGMAFDYEGPVATPFQFFLSDNQSHFFRAALYFNTKVKPDSLAPVHEFVKKDMIRMINTFQWVEKK